MITEKVRRSSDKVNNRFSIGRLLAWSPDVRSKPLLPWDNNTHEIISSSHSSDLPPINIPGQDIRLFFHSNSRGECRASMRARGTEAWDKLSEFLGVRDAWRVHVRISSATHSNLFLSLTWLKCSLIFDWIFFS